MADYRGGDIGGSPYMAETIKDIHNGNTVYQKNRDMKQKAIFAGAQAFLQGAAGSIKGSISARKENEANTKIMQDAIANAKRASGMRADGTLGGQNVGGGPGMGPVPKDAYGKEYDPSAMDNAARGGMNGGMSYMEMTKAAMDNAVKRGRAAQQTNDAASMAPVNGEFTPQGRDAHDEQAQVGAQDLNTSRKLISDAEAADLDQRGSGLMQSNRVNYDAQLGMGASVRNR